MSGWKPIKTAPRDGTAILLYPHLVVATWDFGAENWLVMNILLNQDGSIQGDWKKPPAMFYELMADALGAEPTHWHPLPALRSGQEEQK